MSRKDLFVLAADDNMKGVIGELLRRPQSLGIHEIAFEVRRHPQSDPGVFRDAPEFLRGVARSAERFLVLLDFAWQRPRDMNSPETLRQDLEERLRRAGLEADRCRVLIFAPELEAWLFGDSPHAAAALGFETPEEFRRLLREAGLWSPEEPEPSEPKKAVELALRARRRPRSTAVYRAIARQASLQPERCRDHTFREFVVTLRGWFPAGGQARASAHEMAPLAARRPFAQKTCDG
jgi:hypothetical protein